MDASLRQFQTEGMAAAVAAWDHQITITVQEPITAPPFNVALVTLNGIVLSYDSIEMKWSHGTPGPNYVEANPGDNTITFYHNNGLTSLDDGYQEWNTVYNLVSSVWTFSPGDSSSFDDSPDPWVAAGYYAALFARMPLSIVVLHGIQTDVEVDPGSLEQFGFHVKRVLCFVVNNPSILSTISIGMKAVDNNGEPCKFLYHKRDFLGIHLYFGSVNR